jgi:hypothetical protein
MNLPRKGSPECIENRECGIRDLRTDAVAADKSDG